MCLTIKYDAKKEKKKLNNLRFPLIVWKVMKVEYNSLSGVYTETSWCQYKKGKNTDKRGKDMLFFYKLTEGSSHIEMDESRQYSAGFHTLLKKEDAENLREHLDGAFLKNYAVVPVIVKKKNIVHVGEGQKLVQAAMLKDTVSVLVVKEFHLKHKDYKKAIERK